jgi:uncharacterized membrane protein YkvA (DUF1232 family)
MPDPPGAFQLSLLSDLTVVGVVGLLVALAVDLLLREKPRMTLPDNSTEVLGLSLPGAIRARRQPAFIMRWRQQAQRLHREALVFYFAFKHPRMHWGGKLIAICAAGYLFSPVQLIPNYIPVIGCLDDVLFVFLGVKLLYRITPLDVLSECRELAAAAEMQTRQKIKSKAAVVASTVVVALWLLAAVAGSAVIAACIRR